jgi:hypothetical protein
MIWPRKHIPEVAASISLSGTLFEAIPTAIFGIYFVTRGEPVGAIDSAIWLVSAAGGRGDHISPGASISGVAPISASVY